TTLQANRTATANYQATAASAGNRAVAKVDNDGTTSGSNVLALTVNKANTTTTITADTPDPSLVNQAVTVNYNVSVNAPGAGTPTGNVTVSDGVNSCTATVAAGTCSITLSTLGARTLTATYVGDSNFNGSTSAGTAHSVAAPTATPTNTPTNTPTHTPTTTTTPTHTATPTNTTTTTPTTTSTPTTTATPTNTPTTTPTATATPTNTSTPTNTPTATATPTNTNTSTNTPTNT